MIKLKEQIQGFMFHREINRIQYTKTMDNTETDNNFTKAADQFTGEQRFYYK